LIEKRLGTSEVIHCKRHLKEETEIFNTQGAGSVAFSLGAIELRGKAKKTLTDEHFTPYASCNW